MSDPRKNDIITLEVVDMNNLGFGVGRHGGLVVFVRGGVAGDILECRLIKVNKSYLVGKIERIILPSARRTGDKSCPHSSCGGCVYRNIAYDYELKLKRDYVRSAFRQAGLGDVAIGEVRRAGKTEGYRNKAQYPVGERADGSLLAGFYAPGSHRIAGDADCPLQPPVFAEIAREVCRAAAELGVSAYDEESGRGLLRHIYLRRADMTGEIMVCLVINGDAMPGGERLAARLVGRFPGIVGVLLNINKKNTNVVLGEEYITLAGRPYIEDILCGLRFRVSPESFYQVNHKGAELLYGIAREAALDGRVAGEALLDLYCGAGTIGLSMAGDFKEVTGIDIVPGSIDRARENAAINGILNASFFCGDASEAGDLIAAAERERGSKITADTVILDPPRKGSSPALISYIASRGVGRVVYVSCAPDTLARDCALFRRLGYDIGEIMPVDMFPRTGHVECVVLMSRAEK